LVSIKEDKPVEAEYKVLFNGKYKLMTICMMIAWFSACFIYYGIFLLMPSILARNHATSYDLKYLTLIVINFFEIGSFFLIKPIIDNPLFGRKKTLIYTFLIVVFSALIVCIFG
jgi:hypothetical protein